MCLHQISLQIYCRTAFVVSNFKFLRNKHFVQEKVWPVSAWFTLINMLKKNKYGIYVFVCIAFCSAIYGVPRNLCKHSKINLCKELYENKIHVIISQLFSVWLSSCNNVKYLKYIKYLKTMHINICFLAARFINVQLIVNTEMWNNNIRRK